MRVGLVRMVMFLVLSGALANHTSAQGSQDAESAPVLRWGSKNEAGLYGYIIYRADDRAGPFLRINDRIVPRHDGSVEGESSSYEYRDVGAEAGRTYYYYIDAIGTNGRKQRLTGVARKDVAARPENG